MHFIYDKQVLYCPTLHGGGKDVNPTPAREESKETASAVIGIWPPKAHTLIANKTVVQDVPLRGDLVTEVEPSGMDQGHYCRSKAALGVSSADSHSLLAMHVRFAFCHVVCSMITRYRCKQPVPKSPTGT